jgi:hypothetical protein
MLATQQGTCNRKDERLPVALPINIENTQCITRDVSASGVFFETNSTFMIGAHVDFAIEFDSPGGKLILKCNGEIVRVEAKEGKTGVAVKIVDSSMETSH